MNNEFSFDILTQESNPVLAVAQTKEDNDMLRETENHSTLWRAPRNHHPGGVQQGTGNSSAAASQNSNRQE